MGPHRLQKKNGAPLANSRWSSAGLILHRCRCHHTACLCPAMNMTWGRSGNKQQKSCFSSLYHIGVSRLKGLATGGLHRFFFCFRHLMGVGRAMGRTHWHSRAHTKMPASLFFCCVRSTETPSIIDTFLTLRTSSATDGFKH